MGPPGVDDPCRPLTPVEHWPQLGALGIHLDQVDHPPEDCPLVRIQIARRPLLDVRTVIPDTEAAAIVVKLRDLADQNEGYERSKRELEDFRRWSRGALQRVTELEVLTEERIK